MMSGRRIGRESWKPFPTKMRDPVHSETNAQRVNREITGDSGILATFLVGYLDLWVILVIGTAVVIGWLF